MEHGGLNNKHCTIEDRGAKLMQMIMLINQLILDLVMDDELVEGTASSQCMSFSESVKSVNDFLHNSP